MAMAIAALTTGMGYYLTPLQERPFSPGHSLFASSALVGHGYGVVGSGFMLVGVASYSARRRLPALGKLGKLKTWLQIHIFLCTMGPFLVLLHSAFRVGGLVAIAFWSMVLVVASGIFGRYLYVRIPKTLQGTFLSLAEVERERARAIEVLKEEGALAGRDPEHLLQGLLPGRPRNLLHAFWLGLRWDLGRRGREREVRELLKGTAVSGTVEPALIEGVLKEARLSVHAALLEPFRRLFRYWHVFHLPLAIVMFLILGVHVTVAILFGYAWIF
jgi:hypothetical protein